MTNWQLKRNDTNETIELPQDLLWSDEFDWSRLAQSAPKYTVGGAVVIQQGVKLAGRPITLTGEWVWLKRGDYQQLQDWSAVPALQMTLTRYDGRVFSVIFSNHDKAIDCQPVVYRTPEKADDPYTGSIYLMTV